MKSLCSLFLSLSIFLVLVCVGCDSAMQQNEKTDLVFSFRTPNFRSTQSIEDNPTLLIEACLVDYDGKTIQKTEKEISSGEAVSFQFLKIATNINIKVKIQVFVKGDESPSYIGESDWILTQAGANKVSIMLEKVLLRVNFNSMGGSEVPSQVLESGVVEIPENPTKKGYIFGGWYTSSNNGETLESVFDFDTPIEKDLTLYAKWTPISYTVKFDANNENATGTMDVQNFTYDKAANLNKNAFEVENYGFVEWNTKSDGSGTAYLDEAEILNLTEENGAEITLYAQWIETSTAADYKVEHYRQNIEDDEYTLFETEDKVGTTGETTTASAKSYEGFTAKDFTQAVIAGDGTTIVEIYYDRKDVTLTFDLAGGMSGDSTKIEKTGKYGAPVEKPEDPTKNGYIFDDWYTSSNNGETLESVFDFDTPIEKDLTLYAKWIEIKTSIEVTFPSYDDPEGLITYDEGSQTFTAKEGYSSYEWFIDGKLQGGDQSFILNTGNMTGGIYTVMLIVTTESGDMYSAEWQVTITKIGEN